MSIVVNYKHKNMIIMKKITFLLFAALCLAFASTADAHDFEVDGIYYKITSYEPYTVEVTYSGSSADEAAEYSGNVTIPATVIYNDITYRVTAVGASAFQGNTGLTSVTIPVGVTYLGPGAFISCTALENVSLPEGLVSMGNCCFQFCSALRSITIPNSVTALSDDDNDGVDNGSLEDQNLIGATFMGCKGLKEVTIGAKITNLAFTNGLFNTNADRGELEKVTCYAATPPVVDGNTFLIEIGNARLYVPETSIDAYIAAEHWSNFATSEQNPYSSGAGIK